MDGMLEFLNFSDIFGAAVPTTSTSSRDTSLGPRPRMDYKALKKFSMADLYPAPVITVQTTLHTGDAEDVYQVERLVTKRTLKVNTAARTPVVHSTSYSIQYHVLLL